MMTENKQKDNSVRRLIHIDEPGGLNGTVLPVQSMTGLTVSYFHTGKSKFIRSADKRDKISKTILFHICKSYYVYQSLGDRGWFFRRFYRDEVKGTDSRVRFLPYRVSPSTIIPHLDSNQYYHLGLLLSDFTITNFWEEFRDASAKGRVDMVNAYSSAFIGQLATLGGCVQGDVVQEVTLENGVYYYGEDKRRTPLLCRVILPPPDGANNLFVKFNFKLNLCVDVDMDVVTPTHILHYPVASRTGDEKFFGKLEKNFPDVHFIKPRSSRKHTHPRTATIRCLYERIALDLVPENEIPVIINGNPKRWVPRKVIHLKYRESKETKMGSHVVIHHLSDEGEEALERLWGCETIYAIDVFQLANQSYSSMNNEVHFVNSPKSTYVRIGYEKFDTLTNDWLFGLSTFAHFQLQILTVFDCFVLIKLSKRYSPDVINLNFKPEVMSLNTILYGSELATEPIMVPTKVFDLCVQYVQGQVRTPKLYSGWIRYVNRARRDHSVPDSQYDELIFTAALKSTSDVELKLMDSIGWREQVHEQFIRNGSDIKTKGLYRVVKYVDDTIQNLSDGIKHWSDIITSSMSATVAWAIGKLMHPMVLPSLVEKKGMLPYLTDVCVDDYDLEELKIRQDCKLFTSKFVEPCEPKHGLTFAGPFNPYIKMNSYRSCHHNCLWGIKSRVLAETLPSAISDLIKFHVAELLSEDFLESLPFEQWVNRPMNSLAKREDLKKSEPEFYFKSKARLCESDIFIKKETTVFKNVHNTYDDHIVGFNFYMDYSKWEVHHGDPRIISARNQPFNTKVGPWVLAFSNWLKEKWDINSECSVTYAGGLTSDLLSDWFNQALMIDENPCFINIDFSRFDMTVSSNCIDLELYIYEFCGFPKDIIDVLKLQKDTVGRTKTGIKFTCEGTRKSGDQNTSVGNSVLNGVVTSFAVTKITQHHRIIVMGDDCLICAPMRHIESLVSMLKAVYYEVGWKPKMTISRTPDGAEFLSSRWYRSGGKYYFGPKVARFLSKIPYSLRPLTTLDGKYRLFDISSNVYLDVNHVPLLHEVMDGIYNWGLHYLAGKQRTRAYRKMIQKQSLINDYRPRQKSLVCYDYNSYADLADSYDCTVAELDSIKEKYLDVLKTDFCGPVCEPAFGRIASYDLGLVRHPLMENPVLTSWGYTMALIPRDKCRQSEDSVSSTWSRTKSLIPNWLNEYLLWMCLFYYQGFYGWLFSLLFMYLCNQNMVVTTVLFAPILEECYKHMVHWWIIPLAEFVARPTPYRAICGFFVHYMFYSSGLYLGMMLHILWNFLAISVAAEDRLSGGNGLRDPGSASIANPDLVSRTSNIKSFLFFMPPKKQKKKNSPKKKGTKMVPLADFKTSRVPFMQIVSSTRNGIVVRGYENIAEIQSSLAFRVSQNQPINPANPNLFRQLSGFALAFRKFKLRNVAMHYRSMCPKTRSGSIALVVVPDITGYDALYDIVSLSNYEGACVGSIGDSFSTKHVQIPKTMVYEMSPSNVDLVDKYPMFCFVVSALGVSADNGLIGGMVGISYEFEFLNPSPITPLVMASSVSNTQTILGGSSTGNNLTLPAPTAQVGSWGWANSIFKLITSEAGSPRWNQIVVPVVGENISNAIKWVASAVTPESKGSIMSSSCIQTVIMDKTIIKDLKIFAAGPGLRMLPTLEYDELNYELPMTAGDIDIEIRAWDSTLFTDTQVGHTVISAGTGATGTMFFQYSGLIVQPGISLYLRATPDGTEERTFTLQHYSFSSDPGNT